jgi:uncharacterized protein YbjT (DUF2867 family)
MSVLVLGATGQVGTPVVKALLAAGHQVRTLTRNPEKAAALGAVDARRGDLNEPMSLGPVFAGIDSVFLLNALSVTETQQGLAVVEWAKRAAVKKLVYMSVQNLDDSPHIPHFGGKIAIELAIKASGIDHTILRPNNFFQNDEAVREAIVSYGVYPTPYGSVGVNRVDTRDIADVAVAAFEGRVPNTTIAIAGREAFTGESTAATYSRHLGKPVRYGGDDLDAWGQQVQAFLPPWLVFDLQIMWAAFQKKGLLASAAELEALEKVLGCPPRSFDAYAAELLASPSPASVAGL